MAGTVRAVSVGVAIEQGHVLLGRLAPSLLPDVVYRPIGGYIEFGERASEAVIREFDEEIGRRVEVLRLLDVYENFFDFPSVSVHEVVFLHLMRLDPAPRDLAALPLVEHGAREGDRHLEAQWLAIEALRRGASELYPPNLLDRLGPALDENAG